MTEFSPAKPGEYLSDVGACCEKYLKDDKHSTVVSIWRENMLRYLSLDTAVAPSSQFSSSYALRKVFASQNK